MKRKKPRMEVEWEDSVILRRGWDRIDSILEDRDAVRCMSAGFVLADDRRGVVLAVSLHGDEAVGVTMIPRRAVVRKKRLR